MLLKVLLLFVFHFNLCQSCDYPFEGFGVFLGQLKSFNRTNQSFIDNVVDLMHYDMQIRLFRTEILHEFSHQPNVIKIACESVQTCAWINVHKSFKRLPQDNVKIFASIWSPPHYMKIKLNRLAILDPRWKTGYYQYIKSVAHSIKKNFSIDFERISIVNEPDDVFAEWDHLNMSPIQLCNYVTDYNDSQLAICPETAWFFNLRLYMLNPTCMKSCQIIAVHGYLLSLKNMLVHYDTLRNSHKFDKPIWMTEISGPFVKEGEPQMQEAIDLAISIVNFVGHSCVRRYYYWLAFTSFPSGESLLWSDTNGKLIFPKKYFIYRQFSKSSHSRGRRIAHLCSTPSYYCLQIDNNYVFVNNNQEPVPTQHHLKLCCTTELFDYECGHHSISLPPKSVCSSVDGHKSTTFKIY